MLFDCFTFFNELDLLELRLLELDDIVDRFVLVESVCTFSGNPKPLYFKLNQERFSRWLPRIIHVVVDDDFTNTASPGWNSWAMEAHQRDATMQGLYAAKDEDGIILLDVDEIPNPQAISAWLNGDKSIRSFDQRLSYYWINCLTKWSWHPTGIMTYSFVKAHGPQRAYGISCPVLANGGWHISYAGGPEQVRTKLESFSHQEYNLPLFKDAANVTLAMANGVDLLHRPGKFEFQPLDDTYPQALLANLDKFWHFVHEPTENVAFHECWYSDFQLGLLTKTYNQVRTLEGKILEVGCWEGKSTVALAQACYPEILTAVDNWTGSIAEAEDHPTVVIAKQRDVFRQFRTNIQVLTAGNVSPRKCDAQDFFLSWQEPLKFVHIDASHDYDSVLKTIKSCLLHLVPGGILCGDDFEAANIGRIDLNGGVERAVRELLPGFVQIGNFWTWRNL